MVVGFTFLWVLEVKGVKFFEEKSNSEVDPVRASLVHDISRRRSFVVSRVGYVLMDLINVFTWKETWIVIGCGGLIFAMWCYICFALSMSNPWRSIMIYGLVFILSALACVFNPSGKR